MLSLCTAIYLRFWLAGILIGSRRVNSLEEYKFEVAIDVAGASIQVNKDKMPSRNGIIIISLSIILGLFAGHWYAQQTASVQFVCMWQVTSRGSSVRPRAANEAPEVPNYDFVPDKSTYEELAKVTETARMPGVLIGLTFALLGLSICFRVFSSEKNSNIFAKIGANILLALGVSIAICYFELAEVAKAALIRADSEQKHIQAH